MGGGSAWALAGFFATAFFVGLSGALMPGPVTAVTVAHVGRLGFWTGPQVFVGHAIAEALLVAVLGLGAAAFLSRAAVTGSIAVIGAVVLVWMGWGMVAEGRRGALAIGSGEVAQQSVGPILGGFLASVTNPYWLVWWSTVGLGYFSMGQRWGLAGLVTFYVGHVLSDLVWLSALALALAKGQRVMSDRIYQGLLITMGVFLLVMAIGFCVFGAKQLWTFVGTHGGKVRCG